MALQTPVATFQVGSRGRFDGAGAAGPVKIYIEKRPAARTRVSDGLLQTLHYEKVCHAA